MNPALATPEDQTEWMVLSGEKEALERRLGVIHARCGEIAGRALAIHLQAGKWVIQRSYMVAVDTRARLQIGAILSTALQARRTLDALSVANARQDTLRRTS